MAGRGAPFSVPSAPAGKVGKRGPDMAKEIERKFLVAGDGWRDRATGSKSLRQGYLAETDKLAIRVRIVDEAEA